MKNKAVFLDRDGTINENKNGYSHKIEDLEIIPKVIEGLKSLQDAGYFTEEEYFIFRKEMHRRLREKGIFIDVEYFCPHKPEDNCNCRKPRTGMLEQAVKYFILNLKDCWVIGDSLSDIETGKNAGCRTVHVLTGDYKEPISYVDFTASNMIEAAKYILDCDKNK